PAGGSRLIVPINVNPGTLPRMTWGAWVRTDNTGSGLRKVMGHDNGGWDRTIGMDNRNGPIRYTSFVGNRRPVVGPPGPANTTDWTFFAATYDNFAN
ncbi:MAG: LamG domain-containing protein, partial [Akkermansiaceae bacterium]|nr:LamG domain-containing protein [Akkermansiaceae bacterium]